MSQHPWVYGYVSHIEIFGHNVTSFADGYDTAFVASLPHVTLTIPGLTDVIREFPYLPEIGARYVLRRDLAGYQVEHPKRTAEDPQ